MVGERRRSGDPQWAVSAVRKARDKAANPLQLFIEWSEFFAQTQRLGGGHQLALTAQEQRETGGLLGMLQHLADRGLRDMQELGRAVGRPGQHDCAEDFDMSQTHLSLPGLTSPCSLRHAPIVWNKALGLSCL